MRWFRRLARMRCAVAAGVLSVPLSSGPALGPGAASTSALVERLNAASMRPLPGVAAPAPAPKPDMLWVPDRFVPVVGAPGGVLVPGHWERRISEHEVYVPPLSISHPAGGPELIPGGVRPPADQRIGP